MNGEKALRLFIAAEIPATFRARCVGIEKALRPTIPSARWARPEGIHLTFKFLGDTAPELLPSVREGVTAAAKGLPPFALRTGAGELLRASI